MGRIEDNIKEIKRLNKEILQIKSDTINLENRNKIQDKMFNSFNLFGRKGILYRERKEYIESRGKSLNIFRHSIWGLLILSYFIFMFSIVNWIPGLLSETFNNIYIRFIGIFNLLVFCFITFKTKFDVDRVKDWIDVLVYDIIFKDRRI